jgi:hypothetical protein
MPEPPTAEVAAAVANAVDVYTRNRAVYAKVLWELVKLDIVPPDNPAWPALSSDFAEHDADIRVMVRYVEESCPAVANSED